MIATGPVIHTATLIQMIPCNLLLLGGTPGYTFTSSAESIASIDQNGLLTAHATGEVNVSVADAAGGHNSSLRIRVIEPGNGGGGGEAAVGWRMECPFDQQICDLLCQVSPDLPWCGEVTFRILRWRFRASD